MNPWHRTPAGGLEPGPYPDVPGYAAAAREAYDTGRAVEHRFAEWLLEHTQGHRPDPSCPACQVAGVAAPGVTGRAARSQLAEDFYRLVADHSAGASGHSNVPLDDDDCPVCDPAADALVEAILAANVRATYHGSRADLRDAIAAAAHHATCPNKSRCGGEPTSEHIHIADAVLSVVAPYLDQRDAAREAVKAAWSGADFAMKARLSTIARALTEVDPPAPSRESGPCGDPECHVLHDDPMRPVHPPWYVDSRVALGDASPTGPRPVEPHPAGSHAAWLARYATPAPTTGDQR